MTTKKSKKIKKIVREDEDCDCGCEGKSKAGRKFWIALGVAAVLFALAIAFWVHEATELPDKDFDWK